MWIGRDFLFHLSYYEIKKVLKNFKKSKIKYCLITNNKTNKNYFNFDIKSGLYRELDLFKTPFNFSKNYLVKFNDTFKFKSKKVYKEMILWEKKNLIKNVRFLN